METESEGQTSDTSETDTDELVTDDNSDPFLEYE